RTKQNLDYSFLMMYAQTKGTYYVQLEDDIVARPNYFTTMKNFALQQPSEEWMILEFSQLGFIVLAAIYQWERAVCRVKSTMMVYTRQCSIKLVKTISTTKSIIITLNNEDGICQYSVFVRDQHKDSNECQPARERLSHVECKIENLDPGTWYHLNITSRMDEKQQMQQTLSLPTRPSEVENLQFLANSTCLNISWYPGPGKTERFWIVLIDGRTTLLTWNSTLASTATSYVIKKLIPGRLYNISVVTEVGEIQNSVSGQTQTVPAAVSNLRVENNGSQNILKVLWDKASGDVDSYIVSLTSPGSTPVKRKLSSDTTNVMFDSLSPGKSYQVLVNTTSGQLSNQNWSTGKTAPGKVSDVFMENLPEHGLLKITWTPPSGEWDQIHVVLSNGSEILANQTVNGTAKKMILSGLNLQPGILYSAALSVKSGGLASTVYYQEEIGFPPVSQLHIRHSDETSISALWSHASGSASRDGYIVQLFEGNNSTFTQTRTLTRDMRECTFNVLTPGRLYRLIVTTTRQNLRSSATLEGRTVPLIVNHLKLSNNGNTDSLKASWERPHGDLDFYNLQLFCHKQAVYNISVLTNTTSIVLPFQSPGTLYKLLVTSVSGTQTSKYAEAECRTVPAPPSSVSVSSSSGSLEITWNLPATGDYDDFEVTWFPRDTVHISGHHPTRRILKGLYPGRLYNVSIYTVSGKTHGHMTYSAPVYHTIRTPPLQTPSLHCYPTSSTSLSCFWTAPESDFNGYIVECHKQSSKTPVYSYKLGHSAFSQQFDRLEPFRNYTISITVISGDKQSLTAQNSATTMIDRPPTPPMAVRVSEQAVIITHSTILFKFNCSWFSDVNGAIRFFTVIVTESNEVDYVLPEQRHPLPSYLDYRHNRSIKAYQTGYFHSLCAEVSDSKIRVFEINLGAGMKRLGGVCTWDPESIQHGTHLCDGPLRPRTAYRLSVRAFTQLFDGENREFAQALYTDTYFSLPLLTQSAPRDGVMGGVTAATFLITIVIAVIALLIYRKRAHKIAVQESPVMKMCMWKELPTSQMCSAIRYYIIAFLVDLSKTNQIDSRYLLFLLTNCKHDSKSNSRFNSIINVGLLSLSVIERDLPLSNYNIVLQQTFVFLLIVTIVQLHMLVLDVCVCLESGAQIFMAPGLPTSENNRPTWGLKNMKLTKFGHRRNDLVPPLVKSAAEFMGETKIWQDFYSLAPGLSTSGTMVCHCCTRSCSVDGVICIFYCNVVVVQNFMCEFCFIKVSENDYSRVRVLLFCVCDLISQLL
ncbi:putative receptor-type tyrosine-protein phosphatase beta, partial [Triplophysa rosa]